MQSIKTKTIQSFVVGVASVMAFSVLLLSVHAKDLVQYREPLNMTRVEYHDISDKASGDLHDHVDKQVLKTFAKSFGDNYTMSRGREENYMPETEKDPGLIGRLEERFLMWRIYTSMSFAI